MNESRGSPGRRSFQSILSKCPSPASFRFFTSWDKKENFQLDDFKAGRDVITVPLVYSIVFEAITLPWEVSIASEAGVWLGLLGTQ